MHKVVLVFRFLGAAMRLSRISEGHSRGYDNVLVESAPNHTIQTGSQRAISVQMLCITAFADLQKVRSLVSYESWDA